MAQPVWITPAGSLGIVPEGIYYQQLLRAVDPDGDTVYFQVIAGQLPEGIQVTNTGSVLGVPKAATAVQGIPTEVSRNVDSKFAVRAFTVNAESGAVARIADRTFVLTVSGDDIPEFVTPAGSLGYYYDGDQVDFQFEIIGLDPDDTHTIRLAAGELPGGLSISNSGRLSGYIKPSQPVSATPGYDLTPSGVLPYDFISSSVNRNFEFTLEVTDGVNSVLRTFSIYVYDRASLTADTTDFTSDNSQLTADQGPERRPFVVNAEPNDFGQVRGDNNFGYQFRANDYDDTDLTFAIAPLGTNGAVPGLALDPISGWYYGHIPDVGVTETPYQFNIYVRQTDFVGQEILCTATSSSTHAITCNSTAQLSPGTPVVFSGTALGGISTQATAIYFVKSVLNATQFTIAPNLIANPGLLPKFIPSAAGVSLTTSAGAMSCHLVVASDPYTFDMTVVGDINTQVTWGTPTDLGSIDNGDISLIQIQATNTGNQTMLYRLSPGGNNQLPQGLSLLPTGEIAGQVSFNTFSMDLGTTTFDRAITTTRNALSETTWDSQYEFTVNAYTLPSPASPEISVNRTFTLRVNRQYNRPYQNLLIKAMPPFDDRNLLESLLSNNDIFVPEYIFRPNDPNFGKSTQVIYPHAYGLAPEAAELYVQSMQQNHYGKNLVLGEIKTAQAIGNQGQVLYEVVYCSVVDTLVNQQSQSVSPAVSLPYLIDNPQQPGTKIGVVYPNSLENMRDQVINTVGKISDYLPLWMTSTQPSGRILGYTPAWVLCYVKPGYADQIAYYLQTQFGTQLNQIDFKVDRYILDAGLSKNWDTATQNWTPEPSLTTFDRTGVSETTFDQQSMQFIEPLDMYDSSDAYDKYLLFPKTNILV